jgi:hypothetical protein
MVVLQSLDHVSLPHSLCWDLKYVGQDRIKWLRTHGNHDVWVIFGVDVVFGTLIKETGLQAENSHVLSA